MQFIKNLLYYVSVPKCVHCYTRLSKRDCALCPDCLKEYYNQKARNCSLCARPLYECNCSMKYLDSHFIHKQIKLFRYRVKEELPGNNLIYSLKRDNRIDVIDFLAEELCDAIKASISSLDNFVITSVPRRHKSIVKYGYDHAAVLARKISQKLDLEYKKLLISESKTEQKHTKSREERYKNARFRTKLNAKGVSGKHVILIDDIVTSGASMGSCATLLKGIGAKNIIGASVAIAYKDFYIPFDETDRFDL